MTKEELVQELNFFADKAEPQTEDNIVQLYFHYVEMFKTYCNHIPVFEITSNKGHIEIVE